EARLSRTGHVLDDLLETAGRIADQHVGCLARTVGVEIDGRPATALVVLDLVVIPAGRAHRRLAGGAGDAAPTVEESDDGFVGAHAQLETIVAGHGEVPGARLGNENVTAEFSSQVVVRAGTVERALEHRQRRRVNVHPGTKGAGWGAVIVEVNG